MNSRLEEKGATPDAAEGTTEGTAEGTAEVRAEGTAEATSPIRPKKGVRVWVIALILSGLFVGSAYWVQKGQVTNPKAAEARKPPGPKAVEVSESTRGELPLVAEYRGELDTEIAELAAQGSGRLLEVKVHLGDRFKKGDVLARVDASETGRLLSEADAQVQSAEAEKRRALAELEAAKSEAERGDRLLREQLISEQELAALKSRARVFDAQVSAAEAQKSASLSRVALYREQLSQAELRAPFDGGVGRRYLDSGATVAPGTQVLRLVKGGPLQIRFRASELHVGRLSQGTGLSVTTLGSGSRVYEGELLRVSAEVSRTDRSVEAHGVLKEEYPELRPGMYATVRANLGTLSDATLVPSQALVSKIVADGGTERGLYVTDGSKATYHRVDVVGEHEGRAAVQGVLPGKKVIIQGQDLLSDGAAVKIAERASR